MKMIFWRIIRFFVDSFYRIIDKEIKRVDAFNRQHFEQGGGGRCEHNIK